LAYLPPVIEIYWSSITVFCDNCVTEQVISIGIFYRLLVFASIFAIIYALLSADGASRMLLRQCLNKQYQPLMGITLYCEYESVLKRKKLFERCPISSNEREELFNAFIKVCQWTHIYYLWRPNLRDEADNHIVELAIAGNAETIVTHNLKDFNHTEVHFPNINILSPKQFLTGEKLTCLH
jgi:putative PIN family toxin of toxin-antitoxin system